MEMLVTKFSKGKYRNEGALLSQRRSVVCRAYLCRQCQTHGRDDCIAGASYRQKVRHESRRQTVYRSHQGFTSHE